MSRVAIIGGTGAGLFPVADDAREVEVSTRWGELASPVLSWRQAGHEILFIYRHGPEGWIPPHKVNYRANIAAISELQADAVLSINAVGGIGPEAVPGKVVIPDQLIDFTWGREHSFHEGAASPDFVDFTEPFDPLVRDRLIQAGGSDVINHGVYAVTQGPRLETRAEIDMYDRLGCTLVGMTLMPEAGLARESGLAYASCCHVVNYAAGRSAAPIHEEIDLWLQSGQAAIADLISGYLKSTS